MEGAMIRTRRSYIIALSVTAFTADGLPLPVT